MGVKPEEFGPYLVYEQLGVGGMAAVYRAETRGTFRKSVALKRMLPGIASNSEFVEMFVREARLAIHLSHANIAQIYSLGKVDDTYYIAMELATGPTLRQILYQCVTAAGAMPVSVALAIIDQICDALDYAHHLRNKHGMPYGIVHRDVTPSNVIVSDGVVKLIDFGIAKTALRGTETQVGVIKGKFGYIAPEYLAGQLDSRADLFQVGVLAHEMLTGRLLFASDTGAFETIRNIREMPIQPPSRWNPQVPTELDHVVMTALQRDPEQRWQNAKAFRTALGDVMKDHRLIIGHKRVAEWVAWAFEQEPREDETVLGRVFHQLEPSGEHDVRRDESSADDQDSPAPVSGFTEIPTGVTVSVVLERWQRKRTTLLRILVLCACLIAAIVIAAIYYDLRLRALIDGATF